MYNRKLVHVGKNRVVHYRLRARTMFGDSNAAKRLHLPPGLPWSFAFGEFIQRVSNLDKPTLSQKVCHYYSSSFFFQEIEIWWHLVHGRRVSLNWVLFFPCWDILSVTAYQFPMMHSASSQGVVGSIIKEQRGLNLVLLQRLPWGYPMNKVMQCLGCENDTVDSIWKYDYYLLSWKHQQIGTSKYWIIPKQVRGSMERHKCLDWGPGASVQVALVLVIACVDTLTYQLFPFVSMLK
jgi:hypothetical protein